MSMQESKIFAVPQSVMLGPGTGVHQIKVQIHSIIDDVDFFSSAVIRPHR